MKRLPFFVDGWKPGWNDTELADVDKPETTVETNGMQYLEFFIWPMKRSSWQGKRFMTSGRTVQRVTSWAWTLAAR